MAALRAAILIITTKLYFTLTLRCVKTRTGKQMNRETQTKTKGSFHFYHFKIRCMHTAKIMQFIIIPSCIGCAADIHITADICQH